MKPIYKQLSFWVAFAMTNIGLLLSNNVIGEGDVTRILGWLLTVATALGYKMLPAPKEETPAA